MKVHQVLSDARRGDAITHQALALRDELGADDSLLIAHRFDPSVDGDVVVALDAIASSTGPDIPQDDLVVYHLSIGCPEVVDWLTYRDGPFGIVYHNITPPEFFHGLSWDHEQLTRRGRDDLALLAPHATVVVADSSFNAAEVIAAGGAVDLVHPPLSSTRRLTDLADDRRLARTLRSDPTPRFVHVGQRFPHKRPELLVLGLHLLISRRRTPARLTFVGATPVPAYDRLITTTIDRLVPGNCESLGLVPDRTLATHLRHARAMVTTTAHEGFCVPIVEAMSMGVPVLATDCGAVAETAGGAALLLPPDPAPTVIAEALYALATDDGLVADLRTRGLARAAELERQIDLTAVADTLRSERPVSSPMSSG